MFTNFFSNFKDLKDHHQLFFGFIVFLSTIIFSWAVQRSIEEFFLIKAKNRRLVYITVIVVTLITLLVANYFVKELV